jgi:hypothetical protein
MIHLQFLDVFQQHDMQNLLHFVDGASPSTQIYTAQLEEIFSLLGTLQEVDLKFIWVEYIMDADVYKQPHGLLHCHTFTMICCSLLSQVLCSSVEQAFSPGTRCPASCSSNPKPAICTF